jgi:hypothetical protein
VLNGGDEVYVLDERPSLHRLLDLPTGPHHEWWHFAADDPSPTANTVFVGGDDPFLAFPTRKTVVAVQASGSSRWVWKELKNEPAVDWEITTSMAVTSAGKLLFVVGEVQGDSHTNLKLYRLLGTSPDKEGRIDEGFPKALGCKIGAPAGCKGLPQDTPAGLAVGTDESIYVATSAHGVLKLDSAGNELWRFIGDEESMRVSAVPTVGDDGVMYFTGEPHFFYGVDTEGNRIHRFVVPSAGVLAGTSPAIRDDGAVLVHLGTSLYAFQCTSTALSESAWPRYQRNNRSGGNLHEKN